MSINQGERVAVIGANGAGKSTLLKLLLQQTAPTAGQVENTFASRGVFLNPVRGEASWGQTAWQELAGLIVSGSELLVLDEPTRHLDHRRRQQLAEWLRRVDSTVVVVSHDLEFLDAVASITWHLTAPGFVSASKTPSEFLADQQTEREAYARRYQGQQEKIRQLEHDIQNTKLQARSTEAATTDSGQRRYAKKVAKKALAREKRLEHWKASGEMLKAPRDPHVLRHTWDHVTVHSGTLMRAEGVVLGWDRHILRDVYVTVGPRDRIAVMGNNGSGKSTLVEALLGRFPGRVEGRLRVPPVPYGYVTQVFSGSEHETTWSYFSRRSTLADGFGRAWLQSYGFFEHHLSLPVTALSQGEQVKLEVASWSAAGVSLLVLDEPEHHLDWPSLEAVSRGLSGYPGALVVISHQPRFLDRLGIDTLWTVHQGMVEVGPWDGPGS